MFHISSRKKRDALGINIFVTCMWLFFLTSSAFSIRLEVDDLYRSLSLTLSSVAKDTNIITTIGDFIYLLTMHIVDFICSLTLFSLSVWILFGQRVKSAIRVYSVLFTIYAVLMTSVIAVVLLPLLARGELFQIKMLFFVIAFALLITLIKIFVSYIYIKTNKKIALVNSETADPLIPIEGDLNEKCE